MEPIGTTPAAELIHWRFHLMGQRSPLGLLRLIIRWIYGACSRTFRVLLPFPPWKGTLGPSRHWHSRATDRNSPRSIVGIRCACGICKRKRRLPSRNFPIPSIRSQFRRMARQSRPAYMDQQAPLRQKIKRYDCGIRQPIRRLPSCKDIVRLSFLWRSHRTDLELHPDPRMAQYACGIRQRKARPLS